MKFSEINKIIREISFREYMFALISEHDRLETGQYAEARLYLQAEYTEPDVVTGRPELQKTRKWILSPHMTKSEIVQTAFKCALTSMEHRTREHFLYKNERVYSPHYDVDALVELCRANRFDERDDWYKEDKSSGE